VRVTDVSLLSKVGVNALRQFSESL
jgi:hypothetical protein